MYLRAVQGHSVKQKFNPELQDLVKIPEGFFDHINHVGSSHNLHSISLSGLIARGKDGRQGRQTVFFTAVNPEEEHLDWPKDHDVTTPRKVPYTNIWNVHQNAEDMEKLSVAMSYGERVGI